MEQFFQYLDKISRPYPLQYAIALYDEVMKHKPKVCYELGSSWGFTTCAIAKALSDINEGGKLYSYEIDPRRVSSCKKNLSHLNLDSVCSVETKDIFHGNSLGFTCDFLYIDIHNNGDRVESVIKQMNEVDHIYFEGGSDIRNKVCTERKVSTFENLSYDVIYGYDKKHSFSKLRK